MTIFLFDIAYLLLLCLVSPVLLWRAISQGKYRHGWSHKLFGRVPIRKGDAPCVWLHAVSVGEVNLLPGLVRELAERRPDFQVVISVTTSTGYEVARRNFPEHTVFYCPLDFSWAVRNALSRIRPDMLILAELELWPNLISISKNNDIPVVVFNGRLSESSYLGYQKVRFLLGPVLKNLTLVLAQSSTYAERFLGLGIPGHRVTTTGSVKFDGARQDRAAEQVVAVRNLLGLESQTVWIAGSTQAPEEEICLKVYRQLIGEFSELRLAIVPRHPERFEQVATSIKRAGFDLVRRSSMQQPLQDWPQNTVVLLDTVGELSHWWGVADLAFVGGSFGNRGGQNMIEPAAMAANVCFGPNTKNFRDVVTLLLAANAATVVEDVVELEDHLRDCLLKPQECRQQAMLAANVVRENQGALERSMNRLLPLLDRETSLTIRQQAA